MPVSSALKPGLTEKSRVTILTVDVANRRVEGTLKDGSMIQIAVWEVPEAFRWPQENEVWLVRRDSGIWMLDRRAQVAKTEALPITSMIPGEMKLDSTAIFDAAGHQLVTYGGDIARGRVALGFAASTTSATLIVGHGLAQAPFSVVATAYNASTARIPLLTTGAYSATTFTLQGLLASSFTGTIIVAWQAIV